MKYDAFISYRHLERDMYVAKRVHKALETTKIPRKIQKEIGRKKINRVFRDQEELPIGSDLGSNIETALREAGFLVVICSPQTKESYWVNKEIDTFIQMHGRENVLACLVEGDPSESFPPQLLVDEEGNPVEPLAADVRGNSKREINKLLKTETLRLAAAILHANYDDLRQRHRERKLRRIVGIVSVVAALAIAFAGYTVYNLNKINAEYQQKLINESKVLAKTSLDVLDDGDARVAAMIAMEGLPINGQERPLVADDLYALSQALGTYRLGINLSHDTILTHDVGVDNLAENADGTRLLSYDDSECIYLWNLDTGECIMKLPEEIVDENKNRIDDIGFCENIAVVCSDYFVRGYDENGEQVYEVETKAANTFACVDLYGKYVALDGVEYDKDYNKTYYVQILDAKTGEEVIKYYSDLDVSLGSQTVFNEAGTLAATEHSQTDATLQNYVSVVNIKTGEVADIKVKAGAVMDMYFDNDDTLFVASMACDDIMKSQTSPMYLEHIDPITGSVLWCQQLDYLSGPLNMSYTQVRTSHFDNLGEEQGIVAVSGAKAIYVADTETGEIITTIPTSAFIERIMLSTTGSLIMAGTQDGEINYYNGLTGKLYTEDTVKAANSLIDFKLKSGTFVSMGYRSPMISVMRFDPDDTSLAKLELESGYKGYSASSPSGETFIVSTADNSVNDAYTFYVFKTDGCQQLGTFTVENAMYGREYYIDEDTILVPTYGDKFVYYDVKSGKTEEAFACPEEKKFIDKNLSNNLRYAILFDGRYYFIYDIQKRKTVAYGEMDSSMNDMVVTNDGQTIYACDNDGRAFSVKTDKGRANRFLDEYKIKQFRINPDDTLLSAACADGFLRIYNIETQEIEDEVEYYGDEDDFVQFSVDSNLIYMQGSDLFFRIYDRAAKKLAFITDGQLNDIHYTSFDEDNNRLAIFNDYEMYIVDLDSFGFLDFAEYGRLYIPQKQIVVSVYGTSLVQFPVKNMEDLVAQAQELIGDAKLSDAQKLRYQIN